VTRQRLLLVVGRSCAGKSTMGRRLAERHGAHLVEASAVLRQVLAEMAVESADGPPRGFDYGLVADRIVESMREVDRALVVVCGLRTLREYERLAAHAPHTELVYIHAPRRLRFERCRRRLRNDVAQLPGTFRRLDTNPEHSLLPVARSLARHEVSNTGSLDDYLAAIDALVGDVVRPAPA
jgi:dephospho-CoA kinase